MAVKVSHLDILVWNFNPSYVYMLTVSGKGEN